MNSQKKIEINQSSLLGLKAELLRKKSEVSSAKFAQEISGPRVTKKKLTTKLDKANEGVSERDQRDAEEIREESDELKKSQKMLEAKSKLYDKLVNNSEASIDSTLDTSAFLVDFKQKGQEESESNKNEEETVESDYGEYSDDDDEWVDFVDCLGRTKRCHRDDLEAMKEQDEKLRRSLHGDVRPSERKVEDLKETPLPQLCSEDMKKELLRQKWEEQERNLLHKKDVHYQDVLFHEARTHGVGYYGFSTDEAERARQQEELKNLRKDTEQHQAQSQIAAKKKQKLMEERLKAARRRKRERLGLPPEEEEPEEIKEEEKKPEPPEELRRDVRKPAPIRPWDIGKEKTSKILTQEEWVAKKRAERIEEFAPPSPHLPKLVPKKRQFHNFSEEKFANVESVPIEDELEEKTTKRKGAEIPPPPTFVSSFAPCRTFTNLNQAQIDKSIEEGLNFLRKQVEEKQAKRRRDEDIEIM